MEGERKEKGNLEFVCSSPILFLISYPMVQLPGYGICSFSFLENMGQPFSLVVKTQLKAPTSQIRVLGFQSQLYFQF